MKRTLRFWTTCLLCLAPITGTAPPAKPNILFVVADQWRAQAFGFAGDVNVQTPHLDRFERQCVDFTQAVAGMPVCSPTRASLLTGQRPQTHGVFLNDVPLSTNAVTLPKELKAAGYDTLYNNVADPYQLKNLVGQSAQAQLQSELDALLIPMSDQDETKARRMAGGWRGARREHIRSDLRPTRNEASCLPDQRISLILIASWN